MTAPDIQVDELDDASYQWRVTITKPVGLWACKAPRIETYFSYRHYYDIYRNWFDEKGYEVSRKQKRALDKIVDSWIASAKRLERAETFQRINLSNLKAPYR